MDRVIEIKHTGSYHVFDSYESTGTALVASNAWVVVTPMDDPDAQEVWVLEVL